MKEYSSPGVYTQIYDRSFLQSAEPTGPAGIFVGAFSKGRALIPMKIKDTNDLVNQMGQLNGQFYAPYAAYQYSKHKGDFYTQRILWNQGWKTDAYAIYGVKTDATSGSVLAILMPTTASGTLTNFSMTQGAESHSTTGWTGSNVEAKLCVQADTDHTYTWSAAEILNIDNKVKTNPTQNKPWYVFAKTTDLTIGDLDDFATISMSKLTNYYSTSNGYSSARTPWVYNSDKQELFYFNHLSDGTYTNKDIKIAIQSVDNSSDWTKFDVVVRKYSDTQKKPQVLETFYEVDLNPTSNRYVAKVIGDGYVDYNTGSKKITVNGDYANNSNYIRVVTSDLVKNMDIDPQGSVYTIGRIPFISGSSTDTIDQSYPAIYTSSGELPANCTHQGYNTLLNEIKFLSNPLNDEGYTGSTTKYDTVTDDYVIPFYGGFDGRNPSGGNGTNDNFLNGFDFTDTNSSGYVAFKTAIDLLKHSQQFNIDIISVPGLNLQDDGKAALYLHILQNIAQYRQDIIVPADAGSHLQDNPNLLLTVTQDFDNSYGAVYFPQVKIKCPYTKKLPIVPAATFIPAVIAYTENVSQPHYAPAGINRGVLDVLQPLIKLNKNDRDNLYKNRINPIVSFVNDGTVVWGQKTLQQAESALDRVNVRVLVNGIVKWINDFGKRVLFENNTTSLRTVFSTGVEQQMNSLVAANGLYGYKFVMDESNNTADVIDRNQLVGQLYIKPSKTAQFIIIPINVLRSDAQL